MLKVSALTFDPIGGGARDWAWATVHSECTEMASEPVELKSITLHPVDLQNNELGEEHAGRAELGRAGRKSLRLRRKNIHHLDQNSGKAKMLGVTCNFGTDDFFFISLFGVAIRATW